MALSFGIPSDGAFLFYNLHTVVGVPRGESTSLRCELEGFGDGKTRSRTQFL